MTQRGKFIVIDGMDGSGKGTQIERLREKLKGENVLFTREPGGTPKAEQIRQMLLDKDGPVSNPLCDFFLFWAARASHVEDFIEPARTQGTHVICDRYDSSTYAFQISGEQQGLSSLFGDIRKQLGDKYYPDLYMILDLPPEVAYERRLRDSLQEKSRFDLKPLEYHQRVRKGFEFFATGLFAKNPAIIIDANRPPEVVHDDVWKIISELFAM